jgi:tRNA (guanosine-2'-O-)-methyltransferase
MRRSSVDVHRADELFGSDLEAALRLDPELAIRTLEPLVTDERRARLQEVIAARLDAVTIVMDAPHDPHNGAAVVRSCDAFGVQRLHVIERREPFVVATSVARGSEKWIDVHLHGAAASAIAELRGTGHELFAAEADGELYPDDLRGRNRVAIVIGNERDGIAGELRAACAGGVRVPMRGFVDSLNLSVTTAILLAAATQGRAGDLGEPERRRLYARGLFLTIPRAADVLLGASARDTPTRLY